jgi:SNF2 family DNA or RNA helicase
MLAQDTIEEEILELINKKRKIVGQVVDGEVAAVPMIVMDSLLKEINE